MAAVTICSDFGAPQKIKSVTVSIVSPSVTCHEMTPVFFLGKSHGQRLLAGYSPWGHKESDTAEHTHTYINKAKSSTVSFLNPVILITVPTKHLDQIQRAVKWGRSRGVRRTSEKQTIKLLCCKYTNARMASSKEWESIPIVLTHNTLQWEGCKLPSTFPHCFRIPTKNGSNDNSLGDSAGGHGYLLAVSFTIANRFVLLSGIFTYLLAGTHEENEGPMSPKLLLAYCHFSRFPFYGNVANY